MAKDQWKHQAAGVLGVLLGASMFSGAVALAATDGGSRPAPVVVTDVHPAAALHPGGAVALRARVGNPNGTPLPVDWLVTRVTDVQPAGCPAAALHTHPAEGLGVWVPGGRTVAVTAPEVLHLDRSAPTACAGATFRLDVTVGSGAVP